MCGMCLDCRLMRPSCWLAVSVCLPCLYVVCAWLTGRRGPVAVCLVCQPLSVLSVCSMSLACSRKRPSCLLNSSTCLSSRLSACLSSCLSVSVLSICGMCLSYRTKRPSCWPNSTQLCVCLSCLHRCGVCLAYRRQRSISPACLSACLTLCQCCLYVWYVCLVCLCGLYVECTWLTGGRGPVSVLSV